MLEVYGNFSRNYRAINFSDLRLANPNLVVDPNIQDEKGFTADLGIRGSNNDLFTYELTAFYLSYKDRIGQVRRVDQPPLYREYRFRGNIADARNIGIEMFGKTNVVKWFSEQPYQISLFVNMSFIDAKYIHTEDPLIKNKRVEMVPPITLRSGTTYSYKGYKATLQSSYTGKHFSDASNASTPTATAVEGIIPAYTVWDLSTSYTWKHFTIEASCNNLLNAKYFTRRADSYPGPGIIPSDGRGFYVTLQGKF
jgi:Fe(3+) dicitrate transport protein